MKLFNIILIIFFISCENKPVEVNPKLTEGLVESSVFIDINRVDEPAIKNSNTNREDRIFISVVENIDQNNQVRRRAYIDADHYIGGDEVYIDYGTNFRFGDVTIGRLRDPNPIDYTFRYEYDSDILVSDFNPVFNFDTPILLSNEGDNGQSSSKRIFASNYTFGAIKRLIITNITANQEININETLYLSLNRDLEPTSTIIGFSKIVDEDIYFISLYPRESSSIVGIAPMYLEKMFNKIAQHGSDCDIWVAETKRLPDQFETVDRKTFDEYSTPIIVNFIKSVRVRLVSTSL